MKKIISFMSVLLFATLSLTAQSNYQDVVYLKNGSIIHGIIIEQVPNKSIKIQTSDGNVFFYTVDEIEKITKEISKADTKTLASRPYVFIRKDTIQYNPSPSIFFNIGTGLPWNYLDWGVSAGYSMNLSFDIPFYTSNFGVSLIAGYNRNNDNEGTNYYTTETGYWRAYNFMGGFYGQIPIKQFSIQFHFRGGIASTYSYTQYTNFYGYGTNYTQQPVTINESAFLLNFGMCMRYDINKHFGVQIALDFIAYSYNSKLSSSVLVMTNPLFGVGYKF